MCSIGNPCNPADIDAALEFMSRNRAEINEAFEKAYEHFDKTDVLEAMMQLAKLSGDDKAKATARAFYERGILDLHVNGRTEDEVEDTDGPPLEEMLGHVKNVIEGLAALKRVGGDKRLRTHVKGFNSPDEFKLDEMLPKGSNLEEMHVMHKGETHVIDARGKTEDQLREAIRAIVGTDA